MGTIGQYSILIPPIVPQYGQKIGKITRNPPGVTPVPGVKKRTLFLNAWQATKNKVGFDFVFKCLASNKKQSRPAPPSLGSPGPPWGLPGASLGSPGPPWGQQARQQRNRGAAAGGEALRYTYVCLDIEVGIDRVQMQMPMQI